MYEMLESGKETHVAIARRFGVTPQTVDAFAKLHCIPPKLLLRSVGARVAQHWIRASEVGSEKGLHSPAKDLLLHTGHIDPLQDTAKGAVVVNIGVRLEVVGGDDQALVAPQAITVTATEQET